MKKKEIITCCFVFLFWTCNTFGVPVEDTSYHTQIYEYGQVSVITVAEADDMEKSEDKYYKNAKKKEYVKKYRKKKSKSKSYMKQSEHKHININTATERELRRLRGVGKKTAKNIVEYRNKNGNFKNLDDLNKVKGIRKKVVEKNKDTLSVD